MKYGPLLLLAALPASLYPQAQEIEKGATVAVPRGKLLRSEQVPAKGAARTITRKTKPIKNASLRLFERTQKTCCDELRPLAEVSSGRGGHFQFRNFAPGAYWIVAGVQGTDYKMAITYVPDDKDPAKCSDFLYELNKDHLEIGRVVQVD